MSLFRATEPCQRTISKTGILVGLIVIVCLGVLVVHWPALSAQALSFDDDHHLTLRIFWYKIRVGLQPVDSSLKSWSLLS